MHGKSVINDPHPTIQLGRQCHTCKTRQLGNSARINRLFGIHRMDQCPFSIIDRQHIEDIAFDQSTIKLC